jgi:hypothetical protein
MTVLDQRALGLLTKEYGNPGAELFKDEWLPARYTYKCVAK